MPFKLCVHGRATPAPGRANFEGSAMILGSHDQITIIALLWVRSESGHAPLGKFKGNRDRRAGPNRDRLRVTQQQQRQSRHESGLQVSVSRRVA